MNELIRLLKRLVKETSKEEVRQKAAALLQELEGSFKAPSGMGDRVFIGVQRKETNGS